VTLFLPRGIVGTYHHLMEKRRERTRVQASEAAESAAAEDGVRSGSSPRPAE
jgi:hypothetical protein